MNEEQIGYVRTALAEGRSRESITAALLQSGYTTEQVELLFTLAAAAPGAAAAVVPGVAVLPGVGALLREAFLVIGQRPGLVLVLAGIAVVTTVVSEVSEHGQMGMQLGAALALIPVMIISIFATMVAFRSVITPAEMLSQSMRWVARNIFSLLWVGLLAMLAMLAGAIFIVPAIALIGYTFFSQVAFMKEGVRGIGALVRSTVLVNGYWWAVLWRTLPLILIMLLASFLAGVFVGMFGEVGKVSGGSLPPEMVEGLILGIPTSLLSGVFTVGMFAVMGSLYRALVAAKPAFVPEQHPRLRILYIALTIIGPLALLVLTSIGVVLAIYSASVAGQ